MAKKKGTGKKKASARPTEKIVIPPDSKLPALVSADPRNAALLHTVASSDIRSLDRLVTHFGFKPMLNTVDVNGSTPIHIAAKKNDCVTLQAVLKYGTINIDARELRVIGGHGAVHIACNGGPPSIQVLELLLSNGANPNIKSESTIGETPMHICCKFGYLESARLLLKHGATGAVLDNFGNNAAYWAYQNRQDAMTMALDLPLAKAATAEDLLALMKLKNPKFQFPSLTKKKGKGKAPGGKGAKAVPGKKKK
jgi:ankyrin repeat protein